MTKFRNSLLVTLVLVATLVAIAGTGIAEARSLSKHGWRQASSGSVRPPVWRYSGCGEPDNGNNGLPKTAVPTVAGPAGSGWLVTKWVQLTWTVSHHKHLRVR
ncbi:MAG: hypothetical protein IT348_02140 [Candidatus Eisenbacteria bacterium]|nr:hypothetical protein [Candidatus Eisenbacteria bacterium]